jgi:hypothetical protein
VIEIKGKEKWMIEMVFTGLDFLIIGWSCAKVIKKTCPYPDCGRLTPVTEEQILKRKTVKCEECRRPFGIVHNLEKKIA